MEERLKKKKSIQLIKVTVMTLIIGIGLTQWGQISWKFPPFELNKAKATTVFSMQTGYYVGTGTDNLAITGVGFQPDFVMIKDDTANGSYGVMYKTSVMSGEVSGTLGTATADFATDAIQSLDSDGFTVGTNADVNTKNIRFTWIAFDGSDCTSNGTFCVGSYTGNGTSKSIDTVGFQPNLVIVKSNTTNLPVWRSSSMSNNNAAYFSATNNDTGGTIFTTLDSTGFSVGSSALTNTGSGTYYFIAFQNYSNILTVGTYAGDGVDNKTISTGFQPDFVWVKGADLASARQTVYAVKESNTNYASSFTDTANAATFIKTLDSTTFTLGTGVNVNTSLKNYYWVAFKGATDPTPSGTFTMTSGTYAGSGVARSISGLGFRPDLVIIKHNDLAVDRLAVFRTSMMGGDNTSFFGSTGSNLTGCITSLDSDGFSLGTETYVNASTDTYYWTAYGNAFNPIKNSGAADFAIGAYTGNGVTASDIKRLGFQPDFLALRAAGNFKGVWTHISMASGYVSYFDNVAYATGLFTQFNSDGFRISNSTTVNSAGVIYYFFAFKIGTNFKVGSYSGNDSAQAITGLGFQPDLVWAKITSASDGYMKPSSLAGNAAQYFTAYATLADRIYSLDSDGFTVGSGYSASGSTYYYAAWNGKQVTQSAYRFYSNDNSADVGAVLADRNTAATAPAQGTVFRLRMLLHLTYGTFAASGALMKLQVAARGVDNSCDTSFSGETYADMSSSSGAIRYDTSNTPADGDALTTNTEDPTHSGHTVRAQSYEEGNNFVNAQAAIGYGEDGLWDFALVDYSASAGTTYCFRIRTSADANLTTYAVIPEITTAASAGSLTFSIVDGAGADVGSPSVTMDANTFSFAYQTGTGTLGTVSQKLRVDNGSGTATWSLAMAATDGATALWSDGGSNTYDFNDSTASAGDGGDTDTKGGQLTVNPNAGTITAEGGCDNTGVSKGSQSAFVETSNNSITLMSASGSASTGCYWDLTGVTLSQSIPASQPVGTYTLGLTLTAS